VDLFVRQPSPTLQQRANQQSSHGSIHLWIPLPKDDQAGAVIERTITKHCARHATGNGAPV